MSLMSFHSKTLLHEGNRKNIYQGANNDLIHMSFKKTLDFISHSDILHNQISANFFSCLNSRHISTHFIKTTSASDQTVYNTKVLSIRIRITNIIHHEFHEKLGMSIGQELSEPLIDIISDHTNTIIDSSYLPMLNICTAEQLQQIRQMSMRINDILSSLFYIHQITPASIDLRFGIFNGTFSIERPNGIMLIDELTPDTIHFWHKQNNTMMEYDNELIKLLAPAINLNTSRWNAELHQSTNDKSNQHTKKHQYSNVEHSIPEYNNPMHEQNTTAEQIQDHHDMFAINTSAKDAAKSTRAEKSHNGKSSKMIKLDISDGSIF